MNVSLFLQGYNFNRKTELVALDLIFVSTGFQIPLNKIKFNKPVVMDIRPDIDDDPNTYVTARVDRTFDARIGGNTGFLYRRIPMSFLTPKNNYERVSVRNTPFKTSDILAQFNKLYQCQLTINDVLELTYSGDDFQCTLVANPDSLTWIGTKTIAIDTGILPPLVMQPDLNGFLVYTP